MIGLNKKMKNKLTRILHRHGHRLNDEWYLRILYFLKFDRQLNLKSPKTYNEKCQWLKLNYRKKELISLVDKYEVKNIVAQRIGGEFVVKNYGVWDTFDEIDFDQLPQKFVLKTTHDSSGALICRNKADFDFDKARTVLHKNLSKNAYWPVREWTYKYIKPRIIADELIEVPPGKDLLDFKFFCFHGEPKIFLVESERVGKTVADNFFDTELNPLDLVQGSRRGEILMEDSEDYRTMLTLAKKLCQDLPHIRVDFFYTGEKIYFAEFTFYQHAGISKFYPEKWDEILGSWIDLSKIDKTR